LFFGLAGAGLALDLITKSQIFNRYFDPTLRNQAQNIYWWIDGVLGIQTTTNPGALFGLGQGYSSLFAALSVVALAGILLWMFIWRAVHDRWLTVTLGVICGGIMGNLYDRLGFGYVDAYSPEIKYNVRDWILFQIEGVPLFDPWPNFNIADSLLVCSAALLFIHAILHGDKKELHAGR
jgi:signal peptidase II